KAPAKKAPAKKAATRKAATRKAATRKAATRKAATKKAATKKSSAKKSTAKKSTAKKSTAKKSTAKKAPARKATAKKAPARKSTAKKAPAKKAPAKKSTAKKSSRSRGTARGRGPSALVVREDESPWTREELAEVRGQLRADIERLTEELAEVEDDFAGMMRSTGEGAGNDPADVGSATFERDQEMTIANNAREMLVQCEHALDRIADGTYGVCENCGNPIGKRRLMVFPRATLCMTCKQREERR
ncbi:MAG: TraR/DksA family transcriptional regulator, partial [Marmoricola sp.]